MENYVYCVREQALRENESECFKIGHANDLDRRKSSMQTANPRPLLTVFVLGPFLDRDEAEDVESQAHSLLAEYRVRGEWFDVNPLEVAGFWEWIDAQILPIYIHEKGESPQQAGRKGWGYRKPENFLKRRIGGGRDYKKKPDQGMLDLK